MMTKKCINCEHFKICQQPIKDYDTGLAKCKKHDLYVEFYSERKLNRLECVEQDGDSDGKVRLLLIHG